jgi:MFS superfamily sulfate permease-like transporter
LRAQVKEHENVRVVLLDASTTSAVDATAASAFVAARDEFAADGIVLWVANAHEKSWRRIVSALSNAGAPIPPQFDSLAEAVDSFERLGTGAFETEDS